MVKAVADLTGALVMPNIKPTSIATQDCAMCGLLGGSAGQATDGQADDGLIDPSTDKSFNRSFYRFIDRKKIQPPCAKIK